jgi:hypothetical protein
MLWGPNKPVVSRTVSPEVDWPESETDRSGPFGTKDEECVSANWCLGTEVAGQLGLSCNACLSSVCCS